MDEETKKKVGYGKIFPIVFAVLGVLYCGFVFLYQTENPNDKSDLLTFFMGALITLGGIMGLYQSYATQQLIIESKEKKEEDNEEGL